MQSTDKVQHFRVTNNGSVLRVPGPEPKSLEEKVTELLDILTHTEVALILDMPRARALVRHSLNKWIA